jgi:uridine kinase
VLLPAHPETEAVVAVLAGHIRRALENGACRERGPRALVGIGGTAATGKTTLARLLVEATGEKATILATDGYMMERPERRRRGITGPNPAANDVARLARDLATIVRGEPANVLVRLETPEGRKSLERPFEPAQLVIVEGLIALYAELGARYDVAFFMDGPPEEELAVRLDRDVNERRHPRDEVTAVFGLRQEEYDRYCRPTAARADVRIWADRPEGCYRLRITS